MDSGDDGSQFTDFKVEIDEMEAENQVSELNLRPLCVRICRNCVEFKLERDFLSKKCEGYERQLEELKRQNDVNVRLLKKLQDENIRVTEMLFNSTRKEIQNNIPVDQAQNTVLPIKVELPSLEESQDTCTEDIRDTPCLQQSERGEVDTTDESEDLSELHSSSEESCNSDSDTDSRSDPNWEPDAHEMLEDNDAMIVSEIMEKSDFLQSEWKDGLVEDDTDDNLVPTLMCRWVIDSGTPSSRTCGTSFATSDQLLSHVTLEHATGSDNFNCRWEPCRRNLRGFQQRLKLLDHIQSVHMRERLYRCRFLGCDKVFWNKKAVKSHGVLHVRCRVPCKFPRCTQVFGCRETMEKHYQVFHNQPLKCGVPGCVRMFMQPAHFEAHMVAHNRYRCDFDNCGLWMANQKSFDLHRQMHLQGRLYQCTAIGCEQKFVEESLLQEHVKQHDPRTMFVCYVPIQLIRRPENGTSSNS